MQTKDDSIKGKLRDLIERYRVAALRIFAVATVCALAADQIWPTFHDFIVQNGIVQYATLLLVIDLTISVYLIKRPEDVRMAENQDESMPQLIAEVGRCRGDGIDLLEYAGQTTLPLIRAIQKEGVAMRLLVKHPETIAGLQRTRMITTLDTIFNSIYEGQVTGCEVRCYRASYGLRGRRLGYKVLELGWLTVDAKRQTAFGHANPSVVADLSLHSNDYLRSFFDRTFENLWTACDTEDAREVLARLEDVANGRL